MSPELVAIAEKFVADNAAMIQQADADAGNALAAFAAGRFPEWWSARIAKIQARIEANGVDAITAATDR